MLTGDRELELIPTRTGFVPGMTSVKTSSGTKTKVGARTPSRGRVADLMEEADRFTLLRELLPRVPLGTLRFADVDKVGPASEEKCLLTIAEWEEYAADRDKDGRCTGTFFSSFGRSHHFRRCDHATDKSLCSLCAKMRESANVNKAQLVSVRGMHEYTVVNKSIFRREGTVANMEFWKAESKRAATEEKLPTGYPYFEATRVVTMLLIDSGSIFRNGGKGGRVFRRSAMLVDAQDAFVRVMMTAMLRILRVEGRDKFLKRWKAISSAARRVHKQMECWARQKDEQVGALQAADMIRDELIRAAESVARRGTGGAFVSARLKRLLAWAKMTQKKMGAGASASPSSISSSSPPKSPQQQVTVTPKLKMQRVTTAAGEQEADSGSTERVDAGKTNTGAKRTPPARVHRKLHKAGTFAHSADASKSVPTPQRVDEAGSEPKSEVGGSRPSKPSDSRARASTKPVSPAPAAALQARAGGSGVSSQQQARAGDVHQRESSPPAKAETGNRAKGTPSCSVAGCTKACAKRQADGQFFSTCYDHRARTSS